jgi:hypothetical protein
VLATFHGLGGGRQDWRHGHALNEPCRIDEAAIGTRCHELVEQLVADQVIS